MVLLITEMIFIHEIFFKIKAYNTKYVSPFFPNIIIKGKWAPWGLLLGLQKLLDILILCAKLWANILRGQSP